MYFRFIHPFALESLLAMFLFVLFELFEQLVLFLYAALIGLHIFFICAFLSFITYFTADCIDGRLTRLIHAGTCRFYRLVSAFALIFYIVLSIVVKTH